jgi:hypothetical protein
MNTYYITKDCLTKGIFTLELDDSDKDEYWSKLASGKKPCTSPTVGDWLENVSYIIGKECFLSKNDAMKNANERKNKAILQAKKKIEALEKLKFE